MANNNKEVQAPHEQPHAQPQEHQAAQRMQRQHSRLNRWPKELQPDLLNHRLRPIMHRPSSIIRCNRNSNTKTVNLLSRLIPTSQQREGRSTCRKNTRMRLMRRSIAIRRRSMKLLIATKLRLTSNQVSIIQFSQGRDSAIPARVDTTMVAIDR